MHSIALFTSSADWSGPPVEGPSRRVPQFEPLDANFKSILDLSASLFSPSSAHLNCRQSNFAVAVDLLLRGSCCPGSFFNEVGSEVL